VTRCKLGIRMTFASGDLVRLKSGGPTMTVKSVIAPSDLPLPGERTDRIIECQWFDRTGKLHYGQFAEAALSRMTEAPAPE
jgi:uncharacterized protein YodC (DUF2158 family)